MWTLSTGCLAPGRGTTSGAWSSGVRTRKSAAGESQHQPSQEAASPEDRARMPCLTPVACRMPFDGRDPALPPCGREKQRRPALRVMSPPGRAGARARSGRRRPARPPAGGKPPAAAHPPAHDHVVVAGRLHQDRCAPGRPDGGAPRRRASAVSRRAAASDGVRPRRAARRARRVPRRPSPRVARIRVSRTRRLGVERHDRPVDRKQARRAVDPQPQRLARPRPAGRGAPPALDGPGTAGRAGSRPLATPSRRRRARWQHLALARPLEGLARGGLRLEARVEQPQVAALQREHLAQQRAARGPSRRHGRRAARTRRRAAAGTGARSRRADLPAATGRVPARRSPTRRRRPTATSAATGAVRPSRRGARACARPAVGGCAWRTA